MKNIYKLLVPTALCTTLLVGCIGNDTDKGSTNTKTEQLAESKYSTDFQTLHTEKSGYTDNLESATPDNIVKTLALKQYTYDDFLAALRQSYESPDSILEKLSYQVDKGEGISFKSNLNILFLLDASGSMGKKIGEKTQMDIAKDSLRDFMSKLPEGAHVGLRVYGHKGQGIETDKAKSCSSTDLVYGIDEYDKGAFAKSLAKVKPSGWTPTDLALTKAAEDLKGYSSEDNTNIVYLVSDGISTCDDSPVESAKSLIASDSKPILNVIGFNVDSDARRQLETIAKATDGEYSDVTTAIALSDEFTKLNDMAKKWKESLENQQGEIATNATFNMVEIYNYAARLQQKVNTERDNITYAIDAYQASNIISTEESKQLHKENIAYHKALETSVVEFKENLRNVNSTNSSEAVAEIEKLLKNK